MSEPKVVNLYGVREGKCSYPTRFSDSWLRHEAWHFSRPDISHELALYYSQDAAQPDSNEHRGERVALWGTAVITKTVKE